MEYCKKCGATIDKNTGCCTNCGLHVNDYKEKKGNKVLIVVGIIVAAILLLLGGKAVLNAIASVTDIAPNDGYLEVTEEVINAVYVDMDFEKFASLMPEEVIQTVINDNYDGDAEAFYTKLREAYSSMEDMAADPGSISWKINEEIDMVAAMLDHYEEAYQLENGTLDKIRSVKALDVTISYTSNGEAREDNVYFLFGLIDDEWYLVAYQGM